MQLLKISAITSIPKKEFRSTTSSTLKTPPSLTGITVPITFFRTLHLQTLDCISSYRSIFMTRTQARWYGLLRREWDLTVVDRCVAFDGFREAIFGAQYEISFISLFFTNTGQRFRWIKIPDIHVQSTTLLWNLHCPRFRKPDFLWLYLIHLDRFNLHQSHISCYTRTPGVQHLGFVVTIFPTNIDLLRIYVTLMPGIVWTPLPLIQPVHGYNELALITSNTS